MSYPGTIKHHIDVWRQVDPSDGENWICTLLIFHGNHIETDFRLFGSGIECSAQLELSGVDIRSANSSGEDNERVFKVGMILHGQYPEIVETFCEALQVRVLFFVPVVGEHIHIEGVHLYCPS